nr:hypothetical protein CFP56_28757 [Quercus suber]
MPSVHHKLTVHIYPSIVLSAPNNIYPLARTLFFSPCTKTASDNEDRKWREDKESSTIKEASLDTGRLNMHSALVFIKKIDGLIRSKHDKLPRQSMMTFVASIPHSRKLLCRAMRIIP